MARKFLQTIQDLRLYYDPSDAVCKYNGREEFFKWADTIFEKGNGLIWSAWLPNSADQVVVGITSKKGAISDDRFFFHGLTVFRTQTVPFEYFTNLHPTYPQFWIEAYLE